MKKYIVIEKSTKETKPFLFSSHDEAVQYIYECIPEYVISEIDIDIEGILTRAEVQDNL
jgi:hypothetical protein